jgi:hypothetical protein
MPPAWNLYQSSASASWRSSSAATTTRPPAAGWVAQLRRGCELRAGGGRRRGAGVLARARMRAAAAALARSRAPTRPPRPRRPPPPPRPQPLNVVVKGYAPHVIATPEDLRALLDEARNIQRLQHRWGGGRRRRAAGPPVWVCRRPEGRGRGRLIAAVAATTPAAERSWARPAAAFRPSPPTALKPCPPQAPRAADRARLLPPPDARRPA